MSEKPRRRIQVNISIGADDWASFVGALRSISFDLHEERTEPINIVSGGSNASWNIGGNQDTAWDHDRYFDAINKEIAAIDAEKTKE